jgi:hypothetical protein
MNTVSSLNAKFSQVRSHFAAPHQKLIEQRDSCERDYREVYERANELGMQADGLKSACGAVSVLSKLMASGQLEQLQQIATEQAAAQAGNPFAFLGLRTREGLTQVFGGTQSQEDQLAWQVAGAANLADALAGEKPTEKVMSQLSRDYALKGSLPSLQGTSQEDIATWASQLQSLAQDTGSQATQTHQVAEQRWAAVSDTQTSLDTHWQSRHHNKGQRIADAKAFMLELHQADLAQPGIISEVRNQAPAECKPWLNKGLLDSFRAQLKRTNGDTEAVDWKKVLGQLERTSFG